MEGRMAENMGRRRGKERWGRGRIGQEKGDEQVRKKRNGMEGHCRGKKKG